jgi:Cobalamin biosynthesis protein CobN and related Mg-chelatases
MEVPPGLLLDEEWSVIRRMQGHRVKGLLVEWLVHLAPWQTVATLTFESLAGPEVAERSVRRWLRRVAPSVLAVVAYERQDRGAVHAHLLIASLVDLARARALWESLAGWCRVEHIESVQCVVDYAVKHTAKGLDLDILGASATLC